MSSSAFRERIRTSIANESLQAALDANAERRVNGRVAAFASLPDWRKRRQRAHAVRAEVIEHLDEYMTRFVQKAGENGFIVHRAADAAEAVGLIVQIAEQAVGSSTGNTLVAKSKSMVSEEIELNHALEHHGIRVVETDLGEYIVQLRGEKPAHIITPSVHLRRHEVGRLFQEQLGISYTEDIPTLTAVARKILREVFLTANVGISGVNFGVAETGTICIVTNEGNGRMVTTMPPVHVALMGMERLLPRLADLPLLLSLLPRSATGQKLSVYTQLIHGPRRANEVDGASERHLVIVDNGRSRLQASPLREALYCIRCGACLNACPVFRELGGHAYVSSEGSMAPYPGPIGSVVSPGLLGLEQFGHLAQASSLCGACKDACPVDIDLPKLLTRVRAGGTELKGSDGAGLSPVSKLGLRAYGVIGSSPRIFRAFQTLGALATRLVSPASDWLRIPAVTGWGYSKDFPRVARKPFHQRFQKRVATSPQFVEQALPGEEPSAAQTASAQDLVDRFCLELEALGGNVVRLRTDELYPRLRQLLREKNVNGALAWDKPGELDLQQLAADGITVTDQPDPSLIAGITGAAVAVAETGTLLLTSGPGQPLTASLLPEVHIAIIHADQIVLSLEEALKIVKVQAAAAAVLISGPSRTADIEMTLTIGVHGPRELIVFLVDERAIPLNPQRTD